MQSAYSGNATDNYLIQRINAAGPERLVAMLLEGGQRFLGQAMVAMNNRDVPTKARMINRVSAIIEELAVRLDHEHPSELVVNLARLYDWWLNEVFQGSQNNQVQRLETVYRQMGDLRQTWEQLAQQKASEVGIPASSSLGAGGIVG
ncbi:MAG TPA: flagellar export chaperone FliS [Holophaga sp.]|jgi:flagellar secretion chaperone FliS|nr:flagellar export chaperone FliS [Holophaga sp.]